MVAYNDNAGTIQFALCYRIPVLLCGFYVCYPIGKNAAGNDFPTDRSGADSTYGGRSIWGQIDTIAERYKWTVDYILWGISWANLQLMMSDALRTDYKSKDDEQDNSGMPRTIDLNDPGAMNMLKRLAGA